MLADMFQEGHRAPRDALLRPRAGHGGQLARCSVQLEADNRSGAAVPHIKELIRWIDADGIRIGANGNGEAGERVQCSGLPIDTVTEHVRPCCRVQPIRSRGTRVQEEGKSS
jgi:hypothetical protein